MSQRLTIDGERKLGITVTIGVDGNDDPLGGWPWYEIGYGVFLLAFVTVMFVMIVGTPYFQLGNTMCSGFGSADHPCAPPLRCPYSGLQGRRDMTFPDTDRCPFVLFLPWRLDPVSAHAPAWTPYGDLKPLPAVPAKADRRKRKRPEKKPAGSANGRQPLDCHPSKWTDGQSATMAAG